MVAFLILELSPVSRDDTDQGTGWFDKRSGVVVVTDNLDLARMLVPNADFYLGNDELSNPVDLLVLMSNSSSFIGSNSCPVN